MARYYVGVGLVLALGASVVLTNVAINHIGLIEDLEAETERLAEELEAAQDDLSDQDAAIAKLEDRPTVNIRELASSLVSLRNDLQTAAEGASSEVQALAVRVDDLEYQIERPFGCYPGDPVYWARGFGGGFTC